MAVHIAMYVSSVKGFFKISIGLRHQSQKTYTNTRTSVAHSILNAKM